MLNDSYVSVLILLVHIYNNTVAIIAGYMIICNRELAIHLAIATIQLTKYFS